MKFFDLSPNAELRYSINTKGADLSLPHCSSDFPIKTYLGKPSKDPALLSKRKD